jgi:hypothetical protein
VLEGRALPSTWYAATGSDLIADIKAANTAGGANTIVLTAPTTSPYVLTAVNNTTDGATGLPVISGGGTISGKGKKGTVTVAADNLTIVGNGDAIERGTASGTPAFRLFDVAKGASLTLQNLTLANGLASGGGVWADGGAVYNQGTLVLSGVLVQNNVAEGNYDAAGGGLWSNGSLTLENSTALQADSALGGPSGGNAFGGGLWSNGSLTLENSTALQGNSALGGPSHSRGPGGSAFGGGVYVAGGAVTLTNDSVIGNWADGYDYLGSYTGGIFIASGAAVSLDSLTLYGTNVNTTYSEARGGYVYDSQIVGTYTLRS